MSAENAKFTTGPTMGHVVTMTGTASIGLVAIFMVDALNLLYISMLGQAELAAAIGYAGTLMFFTSSIAIGMTIAVGALVSRELGANHRSKAAQTGGAALLLILVVMSALIALMFPFIDALIGLLGAKGDTKDIAVGFLQIVLPSMPIMAVGMGASGILRGVGDAKRAMYITLIGGAAAAVLDPLFIFTFDLGVTGAAISTVISRFLVMLTGLYGAVIIHKLAKLPSRDHLVNILKPFYAIAVPAVLTQLATPFGNAIVTAQISTFGDEAVAGWAVIGRVIPVAFGVIFALSGAVGPILGQNYGAKKFDRIQQAMRDALIFTLCYVLGVCLLLAFGAGSIADLFGTTGEARDIIIFFCHFVAISFLFNGGLFVANAAFNNLGFAFYSTVFNWGRSTLGVIPFVLVGAHYFGAKGVIAGWGLGVIVFGIAAVITSFRVISKLEDRDDIDPPSEGYSTPAHPAFSSAKSAI